MVRDLNKIRGKELQEILAQVFSGFCAEGVFRDGERTGSGHINDTFLVTTRGNKKYILQRINHSVFQDVPGLMNNILRVTTHIHQKIDQGHPLTGSLTSIRIIPAKDDKTFVLDREGDYWRLYNYLEGSRTFDRVSNPQQAHEGGRAFALFQALTADIPVSDLAETIPHFHDVELRLKTFRQTVSQDPVNRVGEVKREIAFLEERAGEMIKILQLGREHKIPLRVTHNDTKFNNILFDASGKAIAVIDLDTVMPGYILYDFGDAIRTGANTATEDEEDLDKAGINLALFEAYSRGYLSIAGSFLNSCEIGHLAFSARVMTFLIGLRFLTDYIDGDRYYRIHFRHHNLQRARVQMKLLESMEQQYDRMLQIIITITSVPGSIR
jgi:hypothetical protein